MSLSSKELIENKTKNFIYSEILIKLNTQELDLHTFSQKCGKGKPTLFKQLQELEKDGLVDKKKGIGNKKNYSVNWDKIKEECLKKIQSFIDSRKNEVSIFLPHHFEEHYKPLNWFNETNKKKLMGNKLFLEIQKNQFEYYCYLVEKYGFEGFTLENIFTEFITSISQMEHWEEGHFKNLQKYKEEYKQLKQLSEICKLIVISPLGYWSTHTRLYELKETKPE